ncbi:hypothetical protein CYY_002182 [Polysphondylium violaceum]|uniref:Uncharacterized protein n=1 Tax=Polysphondylium violaceum TaxID=133409 RepID=A0A8J4Q0I3_9MYCE|nr:hypothetical protein CYY_002182 [Polysphondylium violaceum]
MSTTAFFPIKQLNDESPKHQDVVNIHHFMLKDISFLKKRNAIATCLENFKEKAIHHIYFLIKDQVFKIDRLTNEEGKKIQECIMTDTAALSALTPLPNSLVEIVETIKNHGDFIIHYTTEAELKENQEKEKFILTSKLDATTKLSDIVKIKKQDREFEIEVLQSEYGYPGDIVLKIKLSLKKNPVHLIFKVYENESHLGFSTKPECPKQIEEFLVILKSKNSDLADPVDTIQVSVECDDYKDTFSYRLNTENRLAEILESFPNTDLLVSILGSPKSGKSTLANNIISFVTSEPQRSHLLVGNGEFSVTTVGEYVSCKKLVEIRKELEPVFPYVDTISKLNLTVLDNPPIGLAPNPNGLSPEEVFRTTKENIEAMMTKQIEGKYPNKNEYLYEARDEFKVGVFINLFNVEEFINIPESSQADHIKLFSIPIETITLKHKSFPIVCLTHYENINPQVLRDILSKVAFPVLKSNIFKIPQNPTKDVLFKLLRKLYEIKRAKDGLIVNKTTTSTTSTSTTSSPQPAA